MSVGSEGDFCIKDLKVGVSLARETQKYNLKFNNKSVKQYFSVDLRNTCKLFPNCTEKYYFNSWNLNPSMKIG